MVKARGREQRWAARVAIDRCPAVKKTQLSAALKSL